MLPTLQAPLLNDTPTFGCRPLILPSARIPTVLEKAMVPPLSWVIRLASSDLLGAWTSRLIVSMFLIVGLMSSKNAALTVSLSVLEGSTITSLICSVPAGALTVLLSVLRNGASTPVVRLSFVPAALMSAVAVKIVLLLGSNVVPLILNSTFPTAGLLPTVYLRVALPIVRLADLPALTAVANLAAFLTNVATWLPVRLFMSSGVTLLLS